MLESEPSADLVDLPGELRMLAFASLLSNVEAARSFQRHSAEEPKGALFENGEERKEDEEAAVASPASTSMFIPWVCGGFGCDARSSSLNPRREPCVISSRSSLRPPKPLIHYITLLVLPAHLLHLCWASVLAYLA